MQSKSTGTVTITSGTAVSGNLNMGAKVLSAIIIPAAWTAAALSFQTSDDNGSTWYDVYDDGGTELTIASAAVVAGRRISVDPSAYAGIDCIRLRSGTTASPVNQGADRIITLVYRKYYALD